jgi:hypothetical protein
MAYLGGQVAVAANMAVMELEVLVTRLQYHHHKVTMAVTVTKQVIRLAVVVVPQLLVALRQVLMPETAGRERPQALQEVLSPMLVAVAAVAHPPRLLEPAAQAAAQTALIQIQHQRRLLVT